MLLEVLGALLEGVGKSQADSWAWPYSWIFRAGVGKPE